MLRRSLGVLSLLLLALPAAATTGTLTQGDSAEHSFELTADDPKALVTVEWRDRAAVFDIVLVSPKGALIQGSVPGLETTVGPVSQRMSLTRKLPESLGWEGTWTVRVRLIDVHRKRPEVSYSCDITCGPTVRLKVDGLGGVHRVGDEVVLQARVRPEDKKVEIEVEDCRARIELEEGDPIEIPLSDDGEGADTGAGDGVFSGRFTWPAAGKHRVAVAVRGTCQTGRRFERETLETVEVRPAR
jgi:hypothetical protein